MASRSSITLKAVYLRSGLLVKSMRVDPLPTDTAAVMCVLLTMISASRVTRSVNLTSA